MVGWASEVEDLVLHGPRVLGFASSARVAGRFGLDVEVVDELLQDHEACGWVRRSSFGGSSGWSVTERGRLEDERRLAVELERSGGRPAVTAAHETFVPLNTRFTAACTDWQVRPGFGDPMASNDHTDWAWDERVLGTLAWVEQSLHRLARGLTAALKRFDGYADRYSSALARVTSGQHRWLDAPELDSCHTVWIQLHEDLLATLGRPRETG